VGGGRAIFQAQKRFIIDYLLLISYHTNHELTIMMMMSD
jgi:hypothetical protein